MRSWNCRIVSPAPTLDEPLGPKLFACARLIRQNRLAATDGIDNAAIAHDPAGSSGAFREFTCMDGGAAQSWQRSANIRVVG